MKITIPKRVQNGRNLAGLLAVLACLPVLQSCGRGNKVATECYQLQEALNVNQPSLAGVVNRDYETSTAQAQKGLAEALSALEISDRELQERRELIVSFAQQLHSLGLQAAEVMTEDGYLSGKAAAQYETITAERAKIYKQLSAERSGLQIHCSLQ